LTGVTLTLKPRGNGAGGGDAAAAAAAWFIGGASPAVWLEEILGWNVALAGLALYVVPRSMKDRAAAGVLVIPGAGVRSGRISGERVSLAQGFVCRAGRLYLPMDAVLWPPVSDAELGRLIAWDVAVMLPAPGGTGGETGFAKGDAIGVEDLIRLPARRGGVWTRGVQGKALPRLKSVNVEIPPTLEMVMEQGRGDIGGKSPQETPGPADEPSDTTMGKLVRGAGDGVAKGIDSVMSGPLGKGLQAFIGAAMLADWAQRKMKEAAEASEFLRNKEINRLLKLLETDPDAGLRHAIPLSDVNRARGVAPPSNSLGTRDVGFSLSRLMGSSGAGDAWAIEAQKRAQLVERYREAANRELRLERYERAAFIYAELLGDFSSAANALKQGRFFREAAVLYRDKLGNKTQAAKCLEEGGLLLEAVEIYRDIPDLMKIGEIYEKLGKMEEAKAVYREEAARLHKLGRVIEAADLLAKRVGAFDEALAMLAQSWPDGGDAGACLEARLLMLDGLGRHEDVRAVIRSVRKDLVKMSGKFHASYVPAVKALTEGVKLYKEAETRRLAADSVRVAVGARLATGIGTQTLGAWELLGALKQLEPGDRVLARDVKRYKTGAEVKEVAAGTGRKRGVSTVRRFCMAMDGLAEDYKASSKPFNERFDFVGQGSALWLARWRANGIGVFKVSWEGEDEGEIHFPFKASAEKAEGIAVRLLPQASQMSVLAVGGTEGELAVQPMQSKKVLTETFPVGLSPGLPERILGWCRNGVYIVTLSADLDGLVLSNFKIGGELVQTWRVGDELVAMTRTLEGPIGDLVFKAGYLPWYPMACVDRAFYIVAGSTVAMVSNYEKHQSISLRSAGTGIYTSPVAGKVAVVVSMRTGAGLLYRDRQGALDVFMFAQDMETPKMAFTGGGDLVVVSGGHGRVYELGYAGATIKHEFVPLVREPVAVVRGAKSNQFAVIGSDGWVQVTETV
jgi:tetratricopeptide (TPR) repeat protein